MPYSTFIFDLDGTLIDTAPGIMHCVKLTLQHFGFEEMDQNTLAKFIGPPIGDSFQKYLKISAEQSNELVEYFREQHASVGIGNGAVYEGCIELLSSLKAQGFKLGVATMKLENVAFKTLEIFNIVHYFDFVAGYCDASKQTKAMLIEKCLAEFHVMDKSSVLMIGDSVFDGEGAQQAGVDYVAMTDGFGYINPEDIDKFPTVFRAKNYRELTQFIKENSNLK